MTLAPWTRVTTENLHEASAQDVYTTVLLHLVEQGKRAAINGYCIYWDSKENLTCAGGCLLEEQDLQKVLEKDLNGCISWSCLVVELDLSHNHQKLIERLQEIHDNFENWHDEGGFKLNNPQLKNVERIYEVTNPFGA